MHPNIKIHVSCDIPHPLTDVRGRKFCSNGQQVKSVEHFFRKNLRIIGRNASGYQNSGKL